MKKQLLYICLLVLLAGTSRAQLNIDSLFLTADSITLINTGFFDEEILNEGFNQVFCHESPFHYATNSKELVNRTLDRLNFRESADILFCGYNYKIYGFRQGEQVYKIDYNTKCNYASIGPDHFWTDSLTQISELGKFIRFQEILCEFQTPELTDCYFEAIVDDQRTELLSIDRNSATELFYRIKLKYR